MTTVESVTRRGWLAALLWGAALQGCNCGGSSPRVEEPEDVQVSSAITAPEAQSVLRGQDLRVTGSAAAVGGTVTRVEISIDEGATWQIAEGTTAWSLRLSAPEGPHVVRSRATAMEPSGFTTLEANG